IMACLSVASPWVTLTKSYTTRRSQPMIRSRLRRPTSKSMTATFLPRRASPQARLALVVVLPTPPLPDVTTMISAKVCLSCMRASVERCDFQLVAFQPHLHGLAAQVGGNVFQHLVVSRDRHEFGLELTAEDARLRVALGTGQGTAAKRAIDVDRAVGDHF